MNRISVLTFALLLLCFESHAKEYRIGIVETIELPIVTDSRNAFIAELQYLLPNDTFEFVIANAMGSEIAASNKASAILTEGNVDLMVSVATLATRAVFQLPETQTQPTLFMTVADPIEENIASAFGQRSTKNITGESHVLDAKVKLDMFHGLIKGRDLTTPINVALIHSGYPSSSNLVSSLVALDSNYPNINLVSVKTPYVAGEHGLATMSHAMVDLLKDHDVRFDGYWLSAGPLAESETLIDDIYAATRLMPLFTESISTVQKGALLGVVSDTISIGKNAARRAVRILEGEAPRDIPVDRTEQFTMAVNVSTAIKLNMPIPSTYLKLSKQHIYH